MIDNKLVIVVGKDGRPSMKGVYSKMQNDSHLAVRRRLQLKGGNINEYWRWYSRHNVEQFVKLGIKNPNFTGKIVVRWGNTIPLDLTGSIVYNKSEAISKATDKKLSREIFQKSGLSCPKIINFEADINSYPIIARPSRHSKGKNFIVLQNVEQYRQHIANHEGWYYSEFVDKTNEYRLHVAHGRVLNYLEKPAPRDPKQIAWNRAQNEDPFVNVKWGDYNGKVAALAIKSLQALGLDFGAVDIMVDRKGQPFLLEVNTAGTLSTSEYSTTRYAKYFDWLCKTNKRREHWEFKEFKKASNFAWHDFHFEDREPNKE